MIKTIQKPLLIICGPTATGKTKLGLNLAEKFSGQLVSADSRQVYQGMDIGTGKDLPLSARFKISALKYQQQQIPYYLINKTRIWGYDLVKPDQDFSLSHFVNIARIIIDWIWQRRELPIIVGGTGLYLKGITKPLATIDFPPDRKLRRRLGNQSVKQLQMTLKKLAPRRFQSMNHSDQYNSRRLIRAIEIARSPQPAAVAGNYNFDVFWLGLTAPLKFLDQNIDVRIDKCLKMGVREEVEGLVSQGYDWNLPAMSAIGYQRWQYFFAGQLDFPALVKSWRQSEKQYLRRQLTWFKKNPLINWFDISENNYQQRLVKQVRAWYTK